jgi:hypothetical protein
MTTYSHTASTPRFGHLRAYLVGIGATTALSAGALVVFLSLATFVAFKGLPLGGSSDDAGAAYLGSNAPAAATAAAALGAARAAVAKDPVPGTRGGGSGSGPGGSGGGHNSGGGSNSAVGGVSGGGGNPPGGGPTDPGGGGGDPGGVPIPLPASSGPVTSAVQSVDHAAGTNLSGPTSGATGAADGAATGALNQAGGAVGHPRLGGQVGGAVNGVTGSGLLGG